MILTFYLVAFIHNITQHRSVLRFPSDEDLNGAAVALMRLQDTYMLDTHALAEGELLGKKYLASYRMGEALAKYEEETNKTVTRQDILEYLAFSTYKQGNSFFFK